MRLTPCLAAVALVGLAALPAQAGVIAVTADRLIDVATGARVERPQVIITDGRITQVGRQGDAVPAGAERLDLPGVTLTPGLIDTHSHLGVYASPSVAAHSGICTPTMSAPGPTWTSTPVSRCQKCRQTCVPISGARPW